MKYLLALVFMFGMGCSVEDGLIDYKKCAEGPENQQCIQGYYPVTASNGDCYCLKDGQELPQLDKGVIADLSQTTDQTQASDQLSSDQTQQSDVSPD